ncbi:hypothetical protein QUC31_004237 [Theobroma cacao]
MGHENKAKNAHVLIFPYPAQGHINPMLQFAKRLISKGVKATLVSTVFLSKTTFSDPTSSIDMQTISDGFDEGGYNQAGSPDVYLPTFWSVGSKSLASLIKKLVDAGHPIDAIVYDAFLDFALDVAKQFGIRTAAFFTQACAVNSVYYHVSRGLLQLPLPEHKVSLPGLPPLEVSELPSFVCHHGSYPAWFDVVVNHQFSNINEADWVFLNIFYDLEKEAVDWMSQFWNVMTIGPTIPSMYLDKRLENDKHYGMHLFKPKTSTSLSLGVPLLAMPQWTDQGTNAKYVEDVWEIGMRARPDEENGFVTREIVEHCIKELTEGEKGKEARKNASKWKNLARKAVDEGGRSDKNIDEFVTKLLGD